MKRRKSLQTLTPEAFEEHVLAWIKAAWLGEPAYICRREVRKGRSGSYEIDILIEFEILGGAILRVLVECKRHRRPIQRDVVLALNSKLRELTAHKAILFSTAG